MVTIRVWPIFPGDVDPGTFPTMLNHVEDLVKSKFCDFIYFFLLAFSSIVLVEKPSKC